MSEVEKIAWRLSLRRFRGWVAYRLVILLPARFDCLWWPLLPWAGLYAHYDCAEATAHREKIS
jgi:hypothetical protein